MRNMQRRKKEEVNVEKKDMQLKSRKYNMVMERDQTKENR